MKSLKFRKGDQAAPPRSDVEKEIERLSDEIEGMQASIRSLLCIYQTFSDSASISASQGSVDSSYYHSMFQIVRTIENEMDSITASLLGEADSGTIDWERLDRLYEKFINMLQASSPELRSTLTLESLQEEDDLPATVFVRASASSDGYDGWVEETEIMSALRITQYCLEEILADISRGSTPDIQDLDLLDHWYQLFISFSC